MRPTKAYYESLDNQTDLPLVVWIFSCATKFSVGGLTVFQPPLFATSMAYKPPKFCEVVLSTIRQYLPSPVIAIPGEYYSRIHKATKLN